MCVISLEKFNFQVGEIEAYVVWRSLLVLVFTERQNNQFSQKKNWSDGQKTLSVTTGIRLACVLIISIPPSIC